jgi:predicted  nucleic acid-binding Zn-ribbon protein
MKRSKTSTDQGKEEQLVEQWKQKYADLEEEMSDMKDVKRDLKKKLQAKEKEVDNLNEKLAEEEKLVT